MLETDYFLTVVNNSKAVQLLQNDNALYDYIYFKKHNNIIKDLLKLKTFDELYNGNNIAKLHKKAKTYKDSQYLSYFYYLRQIQLDLRRSYYIDNTGKIAKKEGVL